MFRFVSDYIPQDVVKNPYYFEQPFYKCLSDKVLQVYESTPETKDKYPFTLFTQKHIHIVLETEHGKLIGLNHNPKLGWTFPTKKAVHKFNMKNMYYIDGKYAIFVKHISDKLVFLFTDTKKQKAVSLSDITRFKKEGKFRECTSMEKLDILYSE